MNDQDIITAQQPEIPSAPASETAYVGAMLAGKVETPFLDADEFTVAKLQIIYEVARKRIQSGEPFAISLLVEDLRTTGELVLIGDPASLEALAKRGKDLAPDVIDEHALNIRQKSALREFKELGDLMQSPGDDFNKALVNAAQEIENIKSRSSISRNVERTDRGSLSAELGEQKWLWPGYIPIGHVTCLVAQQGQGKSFVALDLCHRLVTSRIWPDNTPATEWHNDDLIWYLDTEGFLAGIIGRLETWGTPDKNFIWLKGCIEKRWALNQPRDWSLFESTIARYRPRLVVIDSLSGGNSLKESDNDEMKHLIQDFGGISQKFGTALLFTHHLRKASLGEPAWPIDLDRSRGASAITQFPRSVLTLGTPDRSQPTSRRLEAIKPSMVAPPPPLGFQITEQGLAWGEAPEPMQIPRRADKASDFYRHELRYGKRRSTEIDTEAKTQGISGGALDEAKKKLGLISKPIRGVWYVGYPENFSSSEEQQPQLPQEPQEPQEFQEH